MAETERLCEYCTAIDFEQLRLPSSKDVKRLNKGKPIEPIFPFIEYHERLINRPHWSLGTQSRIERSAATCPFCRQVSLVLETSGIRVKAPAVFEKDPICDVYYTFAGNVGAPPGVTWKRYAPLGNSLREFACTHENIFGHLKPSYPYPWIPYPRISLRWTAPERHHEMRSFEFERYTKYESVIELFECFQSIEMGNNKRRSLFSGRERPALIDLELPRRWLRNCLENDNDCCAPKSKSEGVKTSTFRLIDTKAKAVVEFEQHRLGDTPYVTLSYVWGTTQHAMLKRENLLQLQSAGSLADVTPQTITDAMVFTSDMGYRYLWVDAFCIIQDDDADKMIQIQIMGDIYKSSVFTIAAAAGENSGSGLAGIRTPRTAIQRKVQVKPAGPQEMPLWLISTVMPRTDYDEPYTSSLPWHSRGWTLQERVLSRRMFTFTGEQILWSCRRRQQWEETNTETELASIKVATMEKASLTVDGPLNPYESIKGSASMSWHLQAKFWELVNDFSRRNLCFDGDAHDAFSAILREYTEMTGEQFLWGLPVSKGHFDVALCWDSSKITESLVRRQCLTTLPTTSLQINVPFPSWSWLGWKGGIAPYLMFDAIYGKLKLEIMPYVLRNMPLRLVKTSDIPKDNMSSTTPLFKSGIEIASPLQFYNHLTASESLTLDTVCKTLSPDITPERLSRTPDDQLLFFWCERAYLYLVKPYHHGGRFTVRDTNWERISVLSVFDDLDGKWEAFEDREHGNEKRERMRAEFIAIASHSSGFPSERPWRKKLNVLVLFLIKRREGITYRVAMIDDVSMQTWLECKRERILVALG